LLIPAVLGLTTASYALTKTTAKPPAKAAAKSPVTSPSIATGKKTWALLVGISKYESSQIASLTYPASDIAAIADALKDPKLGNVPADHILMLTNEQATAANIKGAVDTFFKPNVKPGDQILIFLAGHGVAKGVGETAKGYLLPYDVRGLSTQALDASAVNLRDLSNQLSALPASQFVAFVDACREDPTPGRGVKGNVLTDVVANSMQIVPDNSAVTGGPAASAATFFACSVGQRAYEDPKFQHGVFTHYILDGIENGPVPQKPNGAIDLGILAKFVTDGVTQWSKDQSASGDFEVDQTPDFVPSIVSKPVILMDVNRPYPETPIAAEPPTLVVSTFPQGADVQVDGKDIGAGTVQDALAGPGEHTIKASAPGYGLYEKTVDTLMGYPAILTVALPPAGRGLTAANDPENADVPDTYKRALDAEQHRETDVAEAGYDATIAAHPDFVPAYESLAALLRKSGRIGEYVGTLVDLNGQTTPSAHGLSLLAEAYAQYCLQGPGQSTGDSGGHKGSKDYPFPKSQKDAGDLGVKAANAAIALDGTLAEAQRSLGFALVAQDTKLKNERAATKAFAQAAFMDDKDAANHYGLGYCKRVYAQQIKDKDKMNAQLQDGVTELNKAIALRPTYYEAHRELAYCYHLMGDRPNAEKEYQVAASYRGQASDGDEVAGADCAMSALYRQDAQETSDPKKKQDYLAASDGFISDAKDISPNLKAALTILRQAGLSTSVEDYLPDNVRNLIDWKSTISNSLGGLLGGGGIHF
jgi:tetratricopeptide (TPR) repeat protein